MYTLLHTQAIEETMMSDYWTHCYTEGDILVRGRCAITDIPESVMQLQVAFQFEPLAEFQTKEEAEAARDNYILSGSFEISQAAPVIEEEVVVEKIVQEIPTIPTMKLHKVLTEEAEKHPDRQVPWYGPGLKIVREKKGENDGA